jgi:hypothetical protein
MSDDEEPEADAAEEDGDEQAFFAAAAAPAEPAPQAEHEPDAPRFSAEEIDPAASAPRPRFAELEEPVHAPLPRDYADDMGNGVRPAAPHTGEPAPGTLFTDTEEEQRDLDTPAFLRRLQF